MPIDSYSSEANAQRICRVSKGKERRMKTVKENLKTITAYAGADAVNAEGFAAWTPSDTMLSSLLM